MGKKLQRLKEFISTSKPSLISNGNSYEIHKELEAQTERDLRTTDAGVKTVELQGAVESALQDISNRKIKSKLFSEYVLLNYQASYFCGTCKFETENSFIKRLLMLVIRGAFMYGTAGIYKDSLGNVRPVYITSMDYDITGTLNGAMIYSLDLMITNMNKTQTQIQDKDLTLQQLNKEECKNLAVFQWGVMGFSAWITIWPFIKLQYGLLQMIITQTYVYLKKLGYRAENKDAILKELELFFDEANPFIVTSNMTRDISNRIVAEGMDVDFKGSDLIEYYEKTIYSFYHLIGRRINNDVKKERNVSNEVDASQENYDIIQSDWLTYFDIFITDLNKLIPEAKVKNLSKPEERKEEQENEHSTTSDSEREHNKDN